MGMRELVTLNDCLRYSPARRESDEICRSSGINALLPLGELSVVHIGIYLAAEVIDNHWHAGLRGGQLREHRQAVVVRAETDRQTHRHTHARARAQRKRGSKRE